MGAWPNPRIGKLDLKNVGGISDRLDFIIFINPVCGRASIRDL